jgi:uncharacterized membrane protein
MMTTPIDPRVESYLRQLDFALSPLPWEQRNEIFTDISEHIERELASTGGDPAAVEDVLRRVGDPHAIAQEAGAPAAPMPPPRQGRGLEIAAVILISAGSFLIPVLGWIVGVVLLWVSRRFTRADKLIGTLVPPLGFFAPFFLLFAASGSSHSGPCVTRSVPGGAATSCTIHSSSTPAFIPLVILAVLLAAAIYTVIRLSRRISRMA